MKLIEINNQINKELEKIAKKLSDYRFIQFDFPNKNKRLLLSRIFNWLKPILKMGVIYA